MGRVQRYGSGSGSQEFWVIIQVSLDIRSRVRLAWAGIIQQVPVKDGVVVVRVIVMERGQFVDVEFRESAGRHCYGRLFG